MNTIIGEAFVGTGVEAAHVVLAIGSKGTPFETSFMNSLTQRTKGHLTSLALLEPNLPSKPMTLVTNEMTLGTADQTSLFLGPVNAAVAHAVIDSVEEGTIPKDMVEELLILALVFIHWEAMDRKMVYGNNLQATRSAIARAFSGEPGIDQIIERRGTAKHFFYAQQQDEDP
jgi:5,6,7,8-tetrahydromethanopterin hydro-lyase